MDLQFTQGKPLFTTINENIKQYPYLTTSIDTEVIIIGGGVTGSIIAYYFAKQGIDAVILEKARIAHGSTSITTSLLQYELDSNLRDLEQYTTLQNGIESYKLGVKALKEIDNFIKEHGNKCNYKKRDTLLYTAKKEEIAELKEEYELRKAAGLPVDFIEEHNNPFSFDLKAGVYSREGGAEFDPYIFTHHLLEVATQKGTQVYENTEVLEVEYIDTGVKVHTVYGNTVTGKIVILATGFNTSRFSKRQFGTKTTTYNIATEPIEAFSGWPNHVLIRDNEDPYHYLRTTIDNRVIIGGEDIGFVPEILDEKRAEEKYDKLEARLKMMFPDLRETKIEYKYCGAFDSTQDNLGFIGKDPHHENFWYGLGYGANGILFAILGGMMLSKLYEGEVDPALSLFKVDRFDGK